MKQVILLSFLLITIGINAQDFYSDGDCKASFKYEFNPNIMTLVPGVAINFYDTSEGNGKEWYWDFGDGHISNEQNPMFVFTYPLGSPNVKINPYRTISLTIATDSCKSTFSETINIFEISGVTQPTCNALFKYYEIGRDSVSGTLAIHFDNYSEGQNLSYFWQFGDGQTSTEKNPEVKFDLNIPEFKVCLTVFGSDSCSSIMCQPVYPKPPVVWDSVYTDPVQQNCMAIFKYYEMERDSASGTAKIHFDNYSEGDSLTYLWQFGDGTTSTEKNPEVKFSINEPVYKACLTVTGTESCTSTMCNEVYIQPPVIWDTTYTDPFQPDCSVAFGFERKEVLMGPLPSLLVSFYSKSDPPATEWYWDFGDGSTSNEPNPTHVFYQTYNAGSITSDSVYYDSNPYRTVCLTVKTEKECKVSYCETIQVFDYNPQPDPDKCRVYFKYYQPDDVVTIPEVVPIRLVDVSEGDVISRFWQFEDGTTSTEKEPLVMFDIFQPVHKACLTVTFADSCINTFCDYVYVNGGIIDTVVVDPICPYYIKVDGGFPIQMSSCAGWASAKVYLNDSLVEPKLISWSTGDTLAKIDGLCPMQTYTVKALMHDGCAVWTNFVLSADGSITVVSPVNWWVDGKREDLIVKTDVPMGLKVEWQLCDGTVIEADSIQLNSINCGDADMNLILKDEEGNVVYSENISMKAVLTGLKTVETEMGIKLWPNPVNDKLNIRYSGVFQNEIRIEVNDITGKLVASEVHQNISDSHEFSVNTESLKPGIYICRISSGGKIIDSQKFSRK